MSCSSRSRAFTLIELGVVLAVIAVMMSFSVTRMQGFRENAAFERIAGDLEGLAEVGVMYLERGGANFGYINVTAAPALLQGTLPAGFAGINPLNDGPYQIRVVNNAIVDVRTLLPPNSQWVATWNPSIQVVPPACAAGCWVVLRERWLPPASMVPLLMEKRYLYRDCCCPGGTCAGLCGPLPPWYCP